MDRFDKAGALADIAADKRRDRSINRSLVKICRFCGAAYQPPRGERRQRNWCRKPACEAKRYREHIGAQSARLRRLKRVAAALEDRKGGPARGSS